MAIVFIFCVGPCHAGSLLGRFGPRFRLGYARWGAQGVNPAVSRRSGPNSAGNERKCLGEPLRFSCGTTGLCARNVSTIFTFKEIQVYNFLLYIRTQRIWADRGFTPEAGSSRVSERPVQSTASISLWGRRSSYGQSEGRLDLTEPVSRWCRARRR